jgi:1-acyl-sn-glycerol-3-phosphate acyltransferase
MTRYPIALFRATRFALHLVYGLTIAVAFPWFGLSVRRRILQQWSRSLLDIFNVKIHFNTKQTYHGLIVTNHISWLDVFVLNAVVPMRFVAKSEVRRWPAIGWLCARAQTLFIERGKARSAARINMQMVELLQHGECLAVFPEGTTTDGKHLAHFHSSLLQPAINAKALVHPIAIRYQDEHGAQSNAAAYIGDMSFGESLWNILSTRELHVRLIATAPLEACGMDRRSLTMMAHERIGDAVRAGNQTKTFATEYTEITEKDGITQLSAVPDRV